MSMIDPNEFALRTGMNLFKERLGAPERDVWSWIAYAPCILKRGAMRDDALRLRMALEPLGVKLELHGFTYSYQESPAELGNGSLAEKKPWWKFW